MDIKQLTRNPKVIQDSLRVVGQQMLATKEMSIVIPYRFIQCHLAQVGMNVSTLAVFAIITEGNYAVSNVCAMMTLTPSSISVVSIEGEDYYEFGFAKGSVVTPNINMLQDDVVAYNLYNEFIAKGRIPWYVSYEDAGKLLMTAHSYAGITLSGTNAPIEVIISSIARSGKDLYTYYRNTITDMRANNPPPAYVPFKSVTYGATNTAGKVMGSYFDEGLTSALTAPNGGPEGVEIYLRQ